jgi:hypothetical protein
MTRFSAVLYILSLIGRTENTIAPHCVSTSLDRLYGGQYSGFGPMASNIPNFQLGNIFLDNLLYTANFS